MQDGMNTAAQQNGQAYPPGTAGWPPVATQLPLKPSHYLFGATLIAGLFYLLNIGAAYLDATTTGLVKRLAEFFLLNAEKNFPTLFNFGLILVNAMFCSILALAAFAENNHWRWYWVGLALILMFLSFDEAAQIHERFAPLGAYFVEADGIFRFSWVVPAAPAVLLCGLVFLRFVLSQPRRIMLLMILFGAIYLGGAIGIEMASAFHVETGGEYGSFTYHLIAGVEEVVEMFGMALFGYTLMELYNLNLKARRPATTE
ncbi:hypothetical protein [Amaricoccus macauensis]|uniref:hypothetical protein n=1 Tax=Amaricoccus macauensis TaxID=57001 RepID=UPI003C7D967B